MDYTPWSDSRLVGPARRSTRIAFGELVQRHRPLLVAICRRVLRDAELAEDAIGWRLTGGQPISSDEP